jgi:hypothetical protein
MTNKKMTMPTGTLTAKTTAFRLHIMTFAQGRLALANLGYVERSARVLSPSIDEHFLIHPATKATAQIENFKYPPDAFRSLNPDVRASDERNFRNVALAAAHENAR